MKKLLLLAAAATVAIGASGAPDASRASQTHHFEFLTKHHPSASHKVGKKAIRRADAATPIWRWGKQEISMWEEEWIPVETAEFTYTGQGLVATEKSSDGVSVSNTTYEYNADGMRTRQFSEVSEDNGATFENYRLQETQYDSRLTSVVTANADYLWMDGEWNRSGNNYERRITRDASGNITSSVIATWYQGDFDPSERLEVTYGADGKAEKIETWQLVLSDSGNDFEWKSTGIISDITWLKTDGQIFSTDYLMSGANKMLSGVITDEEMTAPFTVEYDPSNENNYEMKFSYYDEEEEETVTCTTNYVELDNNGSYRVVTTTDYNYMGYDYFSETYIETGSYDSYGLALMEQVEYSEGTFQYIVEGYHGEVTYDPTYGYPLEYVQKYYDPDEDDFFYGMKVVFSDYVNAAGIADVSADSETPAEYFNLQGMRVANPETGRIYIVRRGAAVTKELAK